MPHTTQASYNNFLGGLGLVVMRSALKLCQSTTSNEWEFDLYQTNSCEGLHARLLGHVLEVSRAVRMRAQGPKCTWGT
jgi:hypothetical protein